MPKIVIEIESHEKYCHTCLKAQVNERKQPFCSVYGKELKFAMHHFCLRLPECIAAEAEYEKEQWDKAMDCNKCPINTWEACDEICQSKKTLIETVAELSAELAGIKKGVVISTDVAEKLLHEISEGLL